jgi:hypothetical protein
MGKRQPDTGAPPLTAKKTKRREDTPGLTNINQTPLDNPGSHGRIQTMAYTAQQPGVHEPLDDTPPETAEHPRFSSGKRKLYATLERAIEQNTQISPCLLPVLVQSQLRTRWTNPLPTWNHPPMPRLTRRLTHQRRRQPMHQPVRHQRHRQQLQHQQTTLHKMQRRHPRSPRQRKCQRRRRTRSVS